MFHFPIDFGFNKQEKQIKPEKQCFKLPIQYIDSDKLHNLSPIVADDLELINCKNVDGIPMYSYLFGEQNEFSKKIVPQIGSFYTTDKLFLKETQQTIQNFGTDFAKIEKIDCRKIMEIWKDIKEDSFFLEKYSYMEWDMLKHLNESSSFLQCFSIINIVSPLVSLILPIIFLLFPFILLKLQGIPINFSVYLTVLREIAKTHFIGKLISIESFTWDKIFTVLFSFGLYGLQIYQNVTSCYRFYENIKKINSHLYEIQRYVSESIQRMTTFMAAYQNKITYLSFITDLDKHCKILRDIDNLLNTISLFTHSSKKVGEFGYMLKCFYDLHVNHRFEETMVYSFSFNGYLDNIRGLYETYCSGKIQFANFDTDSSGNIHTHMENQTYPALTQNKDCVKTSCNLSKNMILTGINGSGKTTILKTTALNIIFSQQFGCGFYETATIDVYTHIHSYLNIPDTSQRDSLYQAESRRCKEIIDIIGQVEENDNKKSRHFCIFDELFSGTAPESAIKSGTAFLSYLTKYNNVDFILTTHFIKICDKLKKNKRIRNFKTIVEKTDNDRICYTYKIEKGISRDEGAIYVLRDMDYPEEIISEFLE